MYSLGDEEFRYIDDFGVVSEGEFIVDLFKNFIYDNVLVYEFFLYFGCSSIEFWEEVKFLYIYEVEWWVYCSWFEKMKKK